MGRTMKLMMLVCVGVAMVYLAQVGVSWRSLIAGVILIACPLAMLSMHRMSSESSADLHHAAEKGSASTEVPEPAKKPAKKAAKKEEE